MEKPISHNVFEGRRCVEAARKYGRVVQHGTQQRRLVEHPPAQRAERLGLGHLSVEFPPFGAAPVLRHGDQPQSLFQPDTLGRLRLSERAQRAVDPRQHPDRGLPRRHGPGGGAKQWMGANSMRFRAMPAAVRGQRRRHRLGLGQVSRSPLQLMRMQKAFYRRHAR